MRRHGEQASLRAFMCLKVLGSLKIIFHIYVEQIYDIVKGRLESLEYSVKLLLKLPRAVRTLLDHSLLEIH